MKYAIVTIEWCASKGIKVPTEARKSINGNKVIFHYPFIEPVLKESDIMPIYEHDSLELNNILSSAEWAT